MNSASSPSALKNPSSTAAVSGKYEGEITSETVTRIGFLPAEDSTPRSAGARLALGPLVSCQPVRVRRGARLRHPDARLRGLPSGSCQGCQALKEWPQRRRRLHVGIVTKARKSHGIRHERAQLISGAHGIPLTGDK